MMRKVICSLLVFAAVTVLAGPGLDPVFTEYGNLQSALASDNFDNARKAAGAMKDAIAHVDTKTLSAEEKKAWQSTEKNLSTATAAVQGASEIGAARTSFEDVSKALIALAEVASPDGFARFRCPMAFNNKGADWLQKGDTVNNPYFGASMLRCGFKVRPEHLKKKDHGHDHDHDHKH